MAYTNLSEKRFKLFHLQKGICLYCLNYMSLSKTLMGINTGNACTLEHIRPVSKSGSKVNFNNLIVVCASCNNKRENKSIIKFLKNRKLHL